VLSPSHAELQEVSSPTVAPLTRVLPQTKNNQSVRVLRSCEIRTALIGELQPRQFIPSGLACCDAFFYGERMVVRVLERHNSSMGIITAHTIS
jgi:hypothetical protein